MPLTRTDVWNAVLRAGDEHADALRLHHEDAYPASRPTPGEVCKWEAERLTELGLGTGDGVFELVETRVERTGTQLRLTHVLRYTPLELRLLTEPFTGYD